jgi:hypothetical protein
MEMIKLAQQRASEKFHMEWQNAANKATITESAQYLTEVPEYPDADKIIAEAKKMKDFVDKG